jgi:diphosphomevalonate decarboxylase
MLNYMTTAIACSNIAFIKYWGNLDSQLRIPLSSSISMNLSELHTCTRAAFTYELEHDHFTLNGLPAEEFALQRVKILLDRVRQMAGLQMGAEIDSSNNFPTGVGLASSASGFAALTLAVCKAAGLELGESDLSRLARLASGSACRSIPGGFVEWQAGEDDHSSYAFSIAPPEHWDLADCIAILSKEHKLISSYQAHDLANTSPLQSARLADATRRLDLCRRAIIERDFEALARVAELDSNLMHAIIMTSTHPMQYWQPATLEVMRAVTDWRRDGLPAFYTVDAGPNVHVICLNTWAEQIARRLSQLPGVLEVLTTHPGGPAHYISYEGTAI